MTVRLAVLTSGGDAQGMNAAVRAVVRTALQYGAEVHTVHEGYEGLVVGDVRPAGWDSVTGILDRGGTVLGTARSAAFRERAGRRRAAAALVRRGIDRLVVIGGDGSLTGALTLHDEWPQLLAEAVSAGELDSAGARAHPALGLVGVPGSIDNDVAGTDTSIGTDTALHRIVEAIDAVDATAASHRRTFVVEVMGRRCGHLALAAAIAGGADYVLVPEAPPEPGWEDELCALLAGGRAAGRRNSVVVVAEGAQDTQGLPITAGQVRRLIEDRLGEETRVTVPGHVQRGGVPSAADRATASLLGYTAAVAAVTAPPDTEPLLAATRGPAITTVSLRAALDRTRLLTDRAAAADFAAVRELRGPAFGELLDVSAALTHALPTPPGAAAGRIAVLAVGRVAPGMNAAVRAAVRLGLRRGLVMLGVEGGPHGLVAGAVRELSWSAVCGWAPAAGSFLAVGRPVRGARTVAELRAALERNAVDGLLLLGGRDASRTATALAADGLAVPVAVLPVDITSDVPGTEMAVGADTALGHLVDTADRIRQVGAPDRRYTLLETAGGASGHLAVLGGLCGGAVHVTVPEEPTVAQDLAAEAARVVYSFASGQRHYLAVRAEGAEPAYPAELLCELVRRAGGGAYEVHRVVPGQTQYGGRPTPADRVLATRTAAAAIAWLHDHVDAGAPAAALAAVCDGAVRMRPLSEIVPETAPWWTGLRPVIAALARRPELVLEAGA